MLRNLWNSGLVGLGYMLSPLSWWNDLFFNLPIAYAVGYAASWLNPAWFLPATALGYWLSNVLGIVMMQWGATGFVGQPETSNPKRALLISLGLSTAYTVLILGLAYFHILDIPDAILAQHP
ncbi:MAG: hypothetical protein EA367_16315 [Leptolyngbya sp. DLM2.Bin15]|nr:MAG: hypothetical protein EA367_16315 [Leptolyngbya sp. DLM2.Bin15]